jgi:hypothetical protein
MTVEFDTDSKTFSASVDGKAVPNVRAVEISPSWEADDEFRCMFATKSTDEDSGITEIRQLFASKSKQADLALARKDGKAFPSADFPGFVEDRMSPTPNSLSAAVAALFGCK